MPGVFSVTIRNLNTGGQLGCSNGIAVDYTQPDDAGMSEVSLSTDAAGAAIKPLSHTVFAPSGSLKFSLSFASATSQTGKAVTAVISNNGVEQARNEKDGISVECLQPATGGDGGESTDLG